VFVCCSRLYFRAVFLNRQAAARYRAAARGELIYLAPLGSEKISAPYFKQCFFREGVYYPPD